MNIRLTGLSETARNLGRALLDSSKKFVCFCFHSVLFLRARQKARQYLNGHARYKRGGPGRIWWWFELENFLPSVVGVIFALLTFTRHRNALP